MICIFCEAAGRANLCIRGDRIYRSSRADKICKAEVKAFFKYVPKHPHLPSLLALWTGQRQSDLLRLPWSGYDGTHYPPAQIQYGWARGHPVWRAVETALDAMPKRSTVILINADGAPGSPKGFRASWRKACAKAGVVGATFDLRCGGTCRREEALRAGRSDVPPAPRCCTGRRCEG